MILEGFEIENWSCIQRAVVEGLPENGVVVLHGPNGTGKSSIVAALRACLMDYPSGSTHKDLKRWFPKNSTEKPRVSVTFRAHGASWRISKLFGSKDSKLESRAAGGAWRLEASTAAEAHEKTRQLLGGTDSNAGLHQLLWLTQAEVRLPQPKELNTNLQSQLRSVLGVLQTPLDDGFLARVAAERSRWFSARSTGGEKPKLKKDCTLGKALATLVDAEAELVRIETEFRGFERLIHQSESLEILADDLRRQCDEKSRLGDRLQREFERSQERRKSHALATAQLTAARKELGEAETLKQRRAEAEQRVRDAVQVAEKADGDVEEATRKLGTAEFKLRECRRELGAQRSQLRELRIKTSSVQQRRELRSLREQIESLEKRLKPALALTLEFDELRTQEREHPAPDAATLKKLEENRNRAGQLQAELDAAAIGLVLKPDPEATAARAAIDGTPVAETRPPPDGTPIRHLVRRHAEIAIPGWGRIELSRGSDSRSLDQIEAELEALNAHFAEGLAAFAVSALDPAALDQLRSLAADRNIRAPEQKRVEAEIDRWAPDGIESLQQELAERTNRLTACRSVIADDSLNAEPPELERLASQLTREIEALESNTAEAQETINALELEIDGPAEAKSGKKTRPTGLRNQESAAKERSASLRAAAEILRQHLDRMQTATQIDDAIRNAESARDQAATEVERATLSDDEKTIQQRLESVVEGLKALQDQLRITEKEVYGIKGQLITTEGLHQKRAAAAAHVEELKLQTQRETLESQAYDRLVTLFEECREKQLGAVMGPIHDRVAGWMRLLRIGDYQSIRFNDQFLPDTLIARDGVADLAFDQESTGTVEQLGLMVRLALGSTLSKPDESAVAILDDPLTHSDVIRLGVMRAVLRSAAAGEPNSKPPAGPLQILVFTCHPEWFRLDDQRTIDLGSDAVLTRSV